MQISIHQLGARLNDVSATVDGATPRQSDFRLLTLNPGKAEDTITCSLYDASLQSMPDYEAISYVWGDPLDTCTILCSGQPFAITKSLHAALRNFRCEDQERVLWADAICINQEGFAERSEQVLIMRDVYRQARRVLIWLGEETENDCDALDIVLQLEEPLPKVSGNMQDVRAYNTPEVQFSKYECSTISCLGTSWSPA